MQAQTLYDLPTIYDRVVPPGPCDPFYRRLASERGGPVLELACGTGRLTIPLALDGHDVTGLDTSEPMLAAAREKANAAGARATWVRGDMTSFELGRPFDVIIVSCNSLAHMLTTEALVGCLRSIAHHLEPWGTLAFDIVNPNPKRLARPPAERFRRAHSTSDGIRVRERATYDPAGQVLEAQWRVQDSEGSVHHLEPLRLRQTFSSELPTLLQAAGLRLVERFGDFERGRFGTTSRNQVCIARHTASQGR
ncbi:MAG: class I SAM-dependent methyltransferase [Proteobacteria bacterium]|nr:class I SAM-dependent methyltransferase [Pseudomonadota bacterium]